MDDTAIGLDLRRVECICGWRGSIQDYLTIHLPEAWRSKWSRTSENELPHTFHDPNPSHADIPNRYEIAHRNRQVAERLLDLARQYWFQK